MKIIIIIIYIIVYYYKTQKYYTGLFLGSEGFIVYMVAIFYY